MTRHRNEDSLMRNDPVSIKSLALAAACVTTLLACSGAPE